MKMRILAVLYFLFMSAGLVSGYWFGLVELQRLSIWCTWAFSLLGFTCLCIPSEEIFGKPSSTSYLLRTLVIIYVVLLIITGCFLSAAIFVLFLLSFRIKRALWLGEKSNSEKEPETTARQQT